MVWNLGRAGLSIQLNMSGESKKEEFRKYLERSGVIDALTKVLVALYEEPEKPTNALDFIKQYLGAPTSGDVETMKTEKEQLVKQVEDLKKQLEVRNQYVCSVLNFNKRFLNRKNLSDWKPWLPRLVINDSV